MDQNNREKPSTFKMAEPWTGGLEEPGDGGDGGHREEFGDVMESSKRNTLDAVKITKKATKNQEFMPKAYMRGPH